MQMNFFAGTTMHSDTNHHFSWIRHCSLRRRHRSRSRGRRCSGRGLDWTARRGTGADVDPCLRRSQRAATTPGSHPRRPACSVVPAGGNAGDPGRAGTTAAADAFVESAAGLIGRRRRRRLLLSVSSSHFNILCT